MVDTQQRRKYKLITAIRLLLSPSRLTGYHLAVVAVGAAVIAQQALVLLKYPPLLATLMVMPIILSVAGHLYLVGRDNWMDQRNVLHLTDKEIIAVFFLSILLPTVGVLGLSGWTLSDRLILVPLGTFTAFWGIVWWVLAHPYGKERMYYVNDYLETGPEWASASVSMERGNEAQENGEYYAAHYHYTRAERKYRVIEEREEREEYVQAARQHRRAAEEYRTSLAASSIQESRSSVSRARNFLRQAGDILSKRTCDECGKKKAVENVYRVTSPQNIEESIYCSSCYHSTPSYDSVTQETSQTETTSRTSSGSASSTSSTTSSTASSSTSSGTSTERSSSRSRSSTASGNGTAGTTSTTSSNETTQGENPYSSTERVEAGQTTQSEEPARKRRNGVLTVEWACEVLDVERPLTEEELSEAYRERVKETHPDAGGSKEDFKKVKDAKERLDSYVDE